MSPATQAFAAALAALPAMGPERLAALLRRWSPAEAWHAVLRGEVQRFPDISAVCRPDPAEVAAVWQRRARAVDLSAGMAALDEAGIAVHVLGHAGYPPALAADHQAPAVLFSRGDPSVLGGRRVAIVGTRRCSRYGREVAFALGGDLAAAGVRVVSGLALGIDGAAHAGALDAGGAAGPPVAVVGSGLDVVYPRRHARLWEQVAARGLILSEAAFGAPPARWRFPVRNRIIAALAEVVVVVESAHTGGSRHTVEAAMARGTPVMAVPGPVRSEGSDLPNALLAEGCHPARDALDVLVALGLNRPSDDGGPDPRPAPEGADAAVLEVLGWQRTTFEQVVLAAGRPPAEVSVALAHLERDGWVIGGAGWWERCARGRSHG